MPAPPLLQQAVSAALVDVTESWDPVPRVSKRALPVAALDVFAEFVHGHEPWWPVFGTKELLHSIDVPEGSVGSTPQLSTECSSDIKVALFGTVLSAEGRHPGLSSPKRWHLQAVGKLAWHVPCLRPRRPLLSSPSR